MIFKDHDAKVNIFWESFGLLNQKEFFGKQVLKNIVSLPLTYILHIARGKFTKVYLPDKGNVPMMV